MRFDKFTTKFQQALADAQSIAVGGDQQFIEPSHLLLALLNQDDGGTASLLARAGVSVPPLKAALEKAVARLPKVEGAGGEVQIGRDLSNLLNLTDRNAQKRGDQFIASEMFLLALADDKGEAGRLLKEHGLQKKALEAAIAAGTVVGAHGRKSTAAKANTPTKIIIPSEARMCMTSMDVRFAGPPYPRASIARAMASARRRLVKNNGMINGTTWRTR